MSGPPMHPMCLALVHGYPLPNSYLNIYLASMTAPMSPMNTRSPDSANKELGLDEARAMALDKEWPLSLELGGRDEGLL